MAPLALLQDVRGSQLREGGLALAIIFVVIMTVVYHVIYLMMFTLRGRVGQLGSGDDAGDHPDGADQRRHAGTRVLVPIAI